jgi:glutathione S-transferase
VTIPTYALWGSELSPFSLKLRAMLDHIGARYRWRPADGRRLENLRLASRIERVKRGGLPLTYPATSELDEFPQVPYLLGDGGENLYDSSALSAWLDDHHQPDTPLLPAHDATRFVARLIDEYFDEFGLYMAHHNRWVISAATNDAGRRVAREYRFLFAGPLQRPAARWFAARQVRRLPYLFSVAATGFEVEGLSGRLQPPSREGFPPTHALLDRAFLRMLERMELVLSDQEYLLGPCFTLADASAYGQLCMNTHDPSASEIIELRAPLTYAWVQRIERRLVGRTGATAELGVSNRLHGLLEEIGRVFVPLMKQNEAAYERERASGGAARGFNEVAFDASHALYDGELDGSPFRSVVKTFQVSVWRRLRADWRKLGATERAALPVSLD